MNRRWLAAAGANAYLIAVLTVPVILFLSNKEWLFGRGGPTDAWYNVSYYLDYGIREPILYWNYKSVRLSWILKGLLAYKVFPPLVAHYVLHLTMFFAMIVVFYLIASRLFGRAAAFLSTMALATYSQFHAVRSFEWDYNTHDSTLNSLLALLLLLAAARGVRPRLALFFAGAAAASAIQNPYVASYVPVLAFWYWSLRGRPGARRPGGIRMWPSVGYVLAGGAAITAAYCLVSYAVGGPLFYYWPQIKEFLDLYTNGQYRYQTHFWMPISSALRVVQGVQLPAVVTAVSAGLLIYVRRYKRPMDQAPNIVTCGATFLLCMAVAVAWHLAGFPYLYLEHLLATLIPFEFLAIAGLFAAVLGARPVPKIAGVILASTAYTVFMVPLIFGQRAAPAVARLEHVWSQVLAPVFPRLAEALDYSHAYQTYYLPGHIVAPFLVVAIPAGIAAWLIGRVRRYAQALVVILFLTIANVVSASIPLASYAAGFSCGYYRDQFRAVLGSYQAIRPFDPAFNRSALALWYREPDAVAFPVVSCRNRGTLSVPLDETYGAIDGARFFAQLPAHPPFGPVRDFSTIPRASEWWRTSLPDPLRVAVLSSRPEDAALAVGTLEQRGATVRALRTVRIHDGVISFYVSILEFTRR